MSDKFPVAGNNKYSGGGHGGETMSLIPYKTFLKLQNIISLQWSKRRKTDDEARIKLVKLTNN